MTQERLSTLPLDRDVFRLLVETVRDYAIFLLDPQGLVASWNVGAERIKGYRADEIVGRFFGAFYTQADRDRRHPEDELARATATGTYSEEGWRVRKDGTLFWASVVITALRNTDGSLVGFAKVTRDLSDRQRAEATAQKLAAETGARNTIEALHRITTALSHAMLPEQAVDVLMHAATSAVNAARAIFYSYSAEHDHLEVSGALNGSTERLEHYKQMPLAADLPAAACLREGKALFFESPEALVAAYPALAADFAASHTQAMVCLPLLALEQRVGVLTLTFAAETRFSDERRTFLAAVGDMGTQALQRATVLQRDRRNAERSAFLEQASEILASSLDYTVTLQALAKIVVPKLGDWCAIEMAGEGDAPSAQIAVAHVDAAKVEYAWELSRRYPADPTATTGVPNVLRTGKAELYASIPDALLVRGCKDEEHLRITRALGMTSAMILPLRARGRVAGALTLVSAESGISYDQDDFAMAEELARRAGAAIENAELYDEAKMAVAFRDEFLAVASHDLRTPLSTLKLQVQIMLSEPQAAERSAGETKRLTRIDNELNRLAALIDKLLDVSRINLGNIRLDLQEVSLTDLVREVVSRSMDSIRKAECTVDISAPSDVVGQWDKVRLDQVVTNLLSNALKYGATQPVVISIERMGDHARLTIRDRGIGIAAEDHPRLFQKFERAVSSRYYSGVGIGLWICKQIVNAHGGTIAVASTLGAGSSFIVELPLRRPSLTEADAHE